MRLDPLTFDQDWFVQDRLRKQVSQMLASQESFSRMSQGKYAFLGLEPTVTCPRQKRLGKLGDGGKWVCFTDSFTINATSLSFGSRAELSFESELVRVSNWTVALFDPTPGLKVSVPNSRIKFDSIGLSEGPLTINGEPVKSHTLGEFIDTYSPHRPPPLLKVDVEGSEWDVLLSATRGCSADYFAHPFTEQLLVELHFNTLAAQHVTNISWVISLSTNLELCGCRLFHKEWNMYSSTPCCAEFSFLCYPEWKPSLPDRHALLDRFEALKHVGQPHRPANELLVAYLVKPGRDGMLLDSLASLRDAYLAKFPAPVAIFYEVFPENADEIRAVLAGTGSEVHFIRVDFRLPPGLSKVSNYGYKHMCRFWFTGVFEYSIVRNARYVLRLDTDSELRGPIQTSFADQMRAQGAHYGYRYTTPDPWNNTWGLYDVYEQYKKEEGVTPLWRDGDLAVQGVAPDRVMSFGTNFEVMEVPFFLRHDVLRWSQRILDSNMIYHRRWGDAPLRYLTLSMFSDEDRIVRLCGWGYVHKGAIRNC